MEKRPCRVLLQSTTTTVPTIEAVIEDPGRSPYGEPYWPEIVVLEGSAYRVTGDTRHGARVYTDMHACRARAVSYLEWKDMRESESRGGPA